MRARSLLADIEWVMGLYGVPASDRIETIHGAEMELVVTTIATGPGTGPLTRHRTVMSPLVELDTTGAGTPIHDELVAERTRPQPIPVERHDDLDFDAWPYTYGLRAWSGPM
ncbi:hypothetical protein [Cellulomonas sp. SG140]|uniref:hypothetical protein n=1 Tax=Cellulomonas sp. SG140 TaxID=2976536 RepID=UPI0021E8D649|nr:hypothetical protein [Cellulomonas sp. SG140]